MDLSNFLKKLETIAGPVHLLMLMGSDSSMSNSLNLLISAKKFDNTSTSSAIKEVTSFLGKFIKKEDLKKLSRITILKSNEPFVSEINSAFKIQQGNLTIQNCDINGVNIENAIVYQSSR